MLRKLSGRNVTGNRHFCRFCIEVSKNRRYSWIFTGKRYLLNFSSCTKYFFMKFIWDADAKWQWQSLLISDKHSYSPFKNTGNMYPELSEVDFSKYLKWINFRVNLISRIEILKFSRGQNFANRRVLKISRGQNFAKRCSFKFRGFAISKILLCWIAK